MNPKTLSKILNHDPFEKPAPPPKKNEPSPNQPNEQQPANSQSSTTNLKLSAPPNQPTAVIQVTSPITGSSEPLPSQPQSQTNQPKFKTGNLPILPKSDLPKLAKRKASASTGKRGRPSKVRTKEEFLTPTWMRLFIRPKDADRLAAVAQLENKTQAELLEIMLDGYIEAKGVKL